MLIKKSLILSLLVLSEFLFTENIDFANTRLDTIFILQTTDIHGNLFSYDYFQDEPVKLGLTRIYTRILEYRKKHEIVLGNAS